MEQQLLSSGRKLLTYTKEACYNVTTFEVEITLFTPGVVPDIDHLRPSIRRYGVSVQYLYFPRLHTIKSY